MRILFCLLIILLLESSLSAFEIGEVDKCKLQDTQWVVPLVNSVDRYFRARPNNILKYSKNFKWRISEMLHHNHIYDTDENKYSVVKSFSGLSDVHYDQKLFGEYNSTLIRKTKLLRKWAPKIYMYYKDFRPVSIEKLFNAATIYVWSGTKKPTLSLKEEFAGQLVGADGGSGRIETTEDERTTVEWYMKVVPLPWIIKGTKKENLYKSKKGLKKIRALNLTYKEVNLNPKYLKAKNQYLSVQDKKFKAIKDKIFKEVLSKNMLKLEEQLKDYYKELKSELLFITDHLTNETLVNSILLKKERKYIYRNLPEINYQKLIKKTHRLKMKVIRDMTRSFFIFEKEITDSVLLEDLEHFKNLLKTKNIPKEHLIYAKMNLRELGIYDPKEFTAGEKQFLLARIKTIDQNGKSLRIGRYLALNRFDTDNMLADLSSEAHVYGVVREFEDENYNYASLQYHFFQLNSFLPLKIIRWHDGDTEKCQIILRKRKGKSESDFKLYGSECSQHYYATSYPNRIFSSKQIEGKERLNVYISYGSHASNFTPGWHNTAKNEKGVVAALKFYGNNFKRLEYRNFWGIDNLLKLLKGQLIDKSPIPGLEEGKYFTFSPFINKKESFDINNHYYLHTNFPDNSWLWNGFDSSDYSLFLGGKSKRPGGSGPPVPKYAQDIKGRSLFCNPIDHYHYYYRSNLRVAKAMLKMGNSQDVIDIKILFGKLIRLIDEVKMDFTNIAVGKIIRSETSEDEIGDNIASNSDDFEHRIREQVEEDLDFLIKTESNFLKEINSFRKHLNNMINDDESALEVAQMNQSKLKKYSWPEIKKKFENLLNWKNLKKENYSRNDIIKIEKIKLNKVRLYLREAFNKYKNNKIKDVNKLKKIFLAALELSKEDL